ncbi:MAG: hypothetical protein FLDDKLPJ_01564 [Phycisphaerae bacterium]|nr:hypothetical protein [Phycisphaerae bacterium]
MLTIGVILNLLAPLPAEKGEVRWDAPVTTAQVGEPIDLRLVFTNTDDPATPEIPPIDGGELRLVGGPSRSEVVQLIGGRRSREVTYTLVYRFVGAKAGTITIPALKLQAGSREHRTEPLALTITDPPPQSDHPGDRLVYTEIEVDRTRVYLTQMITARLRLGVRKIERGGGVLDDRGTLLKYIGAHGKFDLSIFAGEKQRLTQRVLKDSAGREHTYDVVVFEKVIRAEEEGELRIGPVSAFVEYPTQAQLRRTFFDYELEATRTERVSARSEAVTVAVAAPPREGRPAEFNGAIGVYTFTASAVPTEVEAGQPITLSLAIGGQPIEGVLGPDLEEQTDLAGRFEFSHDDLVGEITPQGKVFRAAVFPRQPGRQTIPSLRWAYFDPDRETYVTCATEPIEVNVLPASSRPNRLSSSAPPSAAHESAPRATALTVVAGGLAANVADPALLLADQDLSGGGALVAALAAPPALLIVLGVVARRRRMLRESPGLARRSRARRHAVEVMSAAAKAPTAPARAGMIGAALAGYLADRFDLPVGQVTSEDARRALERFAAPPALTQRVRDLLSACEAARFSPAAEVGHDIDAARALALIDEIERFTRASRRAPRACSAALPLMLAALNLAASAALADDDPREAIRAGLSAYDRAAAMLATDSAGARLLFEAAAQHFESALAAGLRNGYTEYNLGNAYFQAGRLGEAVLHYRQAQRLIPLNDDLRQNLATARKRCLTYIAPSRTSSVLRSVFFWHHTTSLKARAHVAVGANAAACAGAAVWMFRRRRGWLQAALAAWGIAAGAGGSALAQIAQERRTPPGVVLAADVGVHKGPGAGYERQFAQPLQAGVEFTLRERRGDWWRVTFADGQEGWIPARAAALVVE